MLSQLIQELQSKPSQTVTLKSLSGKLGVDTNVLEGMLEYLFQKGLISVVSDQGLVAPADCDGMCRAAKSDCDTCPFVVQGPSGIEFKFNDY